MARQQVGGGTEPCDHGDGNEGHGEKIKGKTEKYHYIGIRS